MIQKRRVVQGEVKAEKWKKIRAAILALEMFYTCRISRLGRDNSVNKVSGYVLCGLSSNPGRE
jgi:hypothetical protein